MTQNIFDEIFKDPGYRSLKREEKEIYDLLSKVVEEKKNYMELEKEYRTRLQEIADKVEAREEALSLGPEEAESLLAELREGLKEVGETIKTLRQDVRINKLRRVLSEIGEEEFIRRRDGLHEKLVKENSDRAWIQDNIALVKKLKSGSRKIKTAESPAAPPKGEERPREPAEEVKTATAPIMSLKEFEMEGRADATIMAEMTLPIRPAGGNFNSDQTTAIPIEMVGSAPGRILEPALHIHRENGWERFPLKSQDVNIGNIRHPENDIALYDIQVSRRHAKIVHDEPSNCWFLVDLGSRNGSFLNNKFIEPNDPQLLKNNDKITLGETMIVVYIP